MTTCVICGKPISGTYVMNYWKDVYCHVHVDQLPTCFNCGRPLGKMLTNGGVKYKDGRHCCNLCRPKVIGEDEVNVRVLPRIVSLFNTYDLQITSMMDGVRAWLVDVGEIKRHMSRKKGINDYPTGVIRKSVKVEERTTTRGGEVVNTTRVEKKKIHSILVLEGLTEIYLSGVLAHEIGHAYMFMHDFPELPLKVEEGMAELFSFLWLRSRKGPEVNYRLYLMEKNDDPVYGAGFKKAREVMARHGIWKLLAHVKKAGNFPR